MIIKGVIQMKRNQNSDHNPPQKVLSCRYNMNTNRLEAQFNDGTILSIDCIAVEDEYGNTPTQRAELDWLLYNKPLECMPSLCWVVRLSIISRSAVTMAD